MKAEHISLPKLAGLGIGFAVAAAYTASAFTMAMTTSNGAIGAGFFPRIVGILLLVTIGWAIAIAYFKGEAARGERRVPDVIAVGIFFLLCVVFVVLFIALHWFVASVAFLLGVLSWMNKGKHLQNGLVSVGVPLIMFLLFDLWLNASFPQ